MPKIHKIYFFCFGFFFQINQVLIAQYNVIKIEGKVYNEKRKLLINGDKSSCREKFTFSDSLGFIVLYHPEKGRVVKHTKYNKHPLHKQFTLRNAQSKALCDTLKSILKNGEFLVLGNETSIDVYLEHELLRAYLNHATFYITYKHKGNTIKKVIPFNQMPEYQWDYKLYITKDNIFSDTSGQVIPTKQIVDNIKLFVSLPEKGEFFVGFFNPIFIDDESKIKNEIKEIINKYNKTKNNDQIFELIKKHIELNYYDVLDDNLKEWLNKHFKFNIVLSK